MIVEYFVSNANLVTFGKPLDRVVIDLDTGDAKDRDNQNDNAGRNDEAPLGVAETTKLFEDAVQQSGRDVATVRIGIKGLQPRRRNGEHDVSRNQGHTE